MNDATTRTPAARILGTGHHAPARVMTNADLERLVETSDAWIRERTGIERRHVAADREGISDLAVVAARQAIEMAGIRLDDVDGVIMGTISADMPLPSAACFVQAKLGMTRGFAFDLAAACAGFVYGLSLGSKFIAAGEARYVVVIGGELLTKLLNWEDRNTCVLFGDGAGAVVLGPSDGRSGLLSTHLYADGRQAMSLYIPGGGTVHPATHETVDKKMHTVHMNGKEVFKHAVRNMADAAQTALAANRLGPGDIAHVIAHQANLRIIEAVAKRLELPMERFVINIQEYGNTSAGSIPTALNEANRAGRFKPGDLILLTALGAGFAWGSAVVRW